MNRTVTTQVSFCRPFRLPGIPDIQPAGSYVVETEEEQLQAVSFMAWRRLDTVIHLPRSPDSPMVARAVIIDPTILEAALALDAIADSQH